MSNNTNQNEFYNEKIFLLKYLHEMRYIIPYLVLFLSNTFYLFQCKNFCNDCIVGKCMLFDGIENISHISHIVMAVNIIFLFMGLSLSTISNFGIIGINKKLMRTLKLFIVLIWFTVFLSVNDTCGHLSSLIFIKENFLWK